MKTTAKFLLILSLAVGLFAGCKKEEDEPVIKEAGKISLSFAHKVNGQDLVVDTLMYINAAGNQYLVNEIQYFISDVTLHNADGSTLLIKAWNDIHYVDTDIPSTWTWAVVDSIPVGNYTSLSFTFGISEQKNQSYMYVNPPESYMFWPQFLGGGYHYMKLNGKWKDTLNMISPFDFHLGIGQIYASDVIEVDSIIGFVQNYFTVTLPNSAFTIEKDKTRHLEIVMNIESWFETPHIYDHNHWGGAIMQTQPAMQMAKENGFDVFTAGSIQ